MIRLQELRLQKLSKACQKAEEAVQQIKSTNAQLVTEAEQASVEHYNTRQLVNEKQTLIERGQLQLQTE